ncbi:MAG: hypothetical protein K2J39_11200 [Ruminococcus sp.]|nr:hypothetical protein [Ruminococcus sp.]
MKIRNKKIISGLLSTVICSSVFTAVPVIADDMFILGDISNDGSVDAVDATEILQYYSDKSTGKAVEWSEEKKQSADIDGDGEILAIDATWVMMYYAYLSTGDNKQISDIRTYAECIESLENIDFGLDMPDLHASQSFDEETNELSLSWKPVDNISGYKFEFFSPEGKTEEILNDTEYKITLSENIMTSDNTYSYKITPYVDLYDVHKEPEKWINEKVNPTKIIVDSAELTPHDTYPLYNIKGDKPFYSDTYKVTDADRKIMDDFAEEHFTPYMTNYDKLEYTWRWINKNITYASGELYKEIWNDSWVSACMVKKMGQCLQYNGGLAEMLAYYGYDVYMLELWTNHAEKTGQHFRGEVNINDQAYSIEVGNDGKYSGWMWFFRPTESSIAGIDDEN